MAIIHENQAVIDFLFAYGFSVCCIFLPWAIHFSNKDIFFISNC